MAQDTTPRPIYHSFLHDAKTVVNELGIIEKVVPMAFL